MLITGAGGLVGSHLASRMARDHEVVAFQHADLDIIDAVGIDRCVRLVNPALIFNCAVLQVDDCEQNSDRARAINVDGPRFLAEAAAKAGAQFVHFSTQYAFAGEPVGRPPYTVEDAPQPVNVYGRTKVAGEAAALAACARTYIIRTSWVFGSGKASFLCDVHESLRAGKKVRAIDDIWSSTTYVEDLIDRAQSIVGKGRFGTYHVVNTGVCSYYDFALEAGRLLGLEPAQIDTLIGIIHERDMKRIAARPRYTPMRCLLSEELCLPPMRDWREALAAYVKTKPE
ncbi:MAG: SDR family oxidoreductase [Candidatus Binatia bacterium]